MLKILNVLLCLVLLGSFAACDRKTDEEKAQDRASVLVDEQNSIANQLRTMGTPSVTWSETRLNQYENLVDRLESVEEELGSLNGTNGISIYGNNHTTIPAMRSLLAAVRARQTAGSISNITIPTIPTLGPVDPEEANEDFSQVFGEDPEEGERAEELNVAIEAFKTDHPHYLLMDYESFTFEELMDAQAAIGEHVENLTEYNSILEQRYAEATRRTNGMDYNSPARGISQAMNFSLMVEQMSLGSDITTAALALRVIEGEIEEARADGRAEEFLMSQPVAQ